MNKLKLHTPDFIQANIAKLAELFPNCVTETGDEHAELKYAIDFDLLRQELSGVIVEGPQERYQLNWPGKREALLTANAPIAKTLRPCREESVDFDTTQNLYIEGDNLDALKLLQETYLGKVKMIYIDPPYNTGNDFIYEDDFAENTESYLQRSNQKDEVGNRLVANNESNGRFHSDWLTMLYPRIKLARNFLSEDGVIFISIDDNEQANLKRLCDEVFGEQNFVSTIVWEKRYSPQNAVKWFSESHDFIIIYAKNKINWYPNLLARSDEMNARYRNLDNDLRGVWKSVDSTAQAGHGTKSQFYVLTAPNGKQHTLPNGRCWLYTEPVLQQMIKDNRIWFGADGNNVPAVKRFLSEVKQGTACQTIWKYVDVGHNQEAKKEVNDLFPESTVFETPKPSRLIKRILQISTDKNDIILDFFSGSATSAHAVMQLNAEDDGNRKFIMVQLPEVCDEKSEAYKAGYKTIAEIGKERIRRAGQKIKTEVGRMKNETKPDGSVLPLDIGFRVLKVDSSNMKDVYYQPDQLKQGDLEHFTDNIKPDRTAEDLLFQVLLDWGVDLSLPISQETILVKDEQISSFTVFFVDGNALAACFDTGINEAFVKELAKRQPLRVVFRDAGFSSDSVKINVEQVFKLISPNTEIKVI
ncbi:site-specific DNA-methyltransferase [Methylomonas paludis]|uniref:site-specific DNA-methyltransferase (adenine-specific) n=1 Tax=Methylomonas paludis TaxID=1173101 RepID=A0A975RBB0_9GAMM|nr:site-specific DNA-methyltransferase [Methylomonas paludis]QWF72096.1 site-specific DNA-methyltransferase [Methylomonas paludis]